MVVSYSLPFPKPFSCFCSSAEISTQPPPDLLPVLSGNKWESFLKKKVVMRVGYVGTDYRGPSFFHLLKCKLIFIFWDDVIFIFFFSGLQMQRNEHALSSKLLLLIVPLVIVEK